MNKTLKLFDKLSKLYEQEEVDAEVDVQSNPVELSVAAEKYLTKLAALAFTYSPSIEEQNIINSLVTGFDPDSPDEEKKIIETNPKIITDKIQEYLISSDQSLAAELENL
jgi:hypothetical protein|tara:strand:+ start:401 stop:730 length:330 start_codon:yes stop_codon:yes gene_type:complete